MKKQKLTTADKKYLAHRAWMSVVEKSNSYPPWIKEYFFNDLDAYSSAINRNAILN